jgi:hypothetical protein
VGWTSKLLPFARHVFHGYGFGNSTKIRVADASYVLWRAAAEREKSLMFMIAEYCQMDKKCKN